MCDPAGTSLVIPLEEITQPSATTAPMDATSPPDSLSHRTSLGLEK